MKKFFVIILLFLIFAPVITADAKPKEKELSLYLYQDYKDCMFFVNWENAKKEAEIKIQRPDGKKIKINEKNTVFKDGQAAIHVGKAVSGYWTIFVAGKNLGSISVTGGDRDSKEVYNAIQNFDVDVANNNIHFKWKVITKQDTINVSIYATQGNEYGSRLLWNNYSAKKSDTASVSVNELQTGIYHFFIQVYDGSMQYTLAINTPVYIIQSEAPEKLENIRVGSIDGEMFAAWDNHINDHYIVTLYDYETLDVIKSEWVYTNFYTISLDDYDLDQIKFSVSAQENEASGQFDVFEIRRSIPQGTITFPDIQSTRKSVISISVDCPDDVMAGVYLDDVQLMEHMETGEYDLTLSEGTHNIVAYLKDENGGMKTFVKAITVDKTPPSIRLSQTDKMRTTADNIILEGDTEPNATVAINGVQQQIEAGNFTAKLALQNGINPITVSAYDTAGNKSVITTMAERADTLQNGWLKFILPSIVFVILTVWYIYINKEAKKGA